MTNTFSQQQKVLEALKKDSLKEREC